MANITVTITDTELKALETVVIDTQEWANNAVQNKARKAVVSICAALLQHLCKLHVPSTTPMILSRIPDL